MNKSIEFLEYVLKVAVANKPEEVEWVVEQLFRAIKFGDENGN